MIMCQENHKISNLKDAKDQRRGNVNQHIENIVVVKLPLLVLLKTGKSQKMKACLSAFYLRTCPKHLTRFIGLYC